MKKTGIFLIVMVMAGMLFPQAGTAPAAAAETAPEESIRAVLEETVHTLAGAIAQQQAGQEALGTPENFAWASDTGGLPDAAGIRVTWDPVSGADGYEYVFYYFWDTDNSVTDTGETAEPGQSMYFQDATNLKMEVRAFRLVNGEKVYGEWNSSVLPEEELFRL